MTNPMRARFLALFLAWPGAAAVVAQTPPAAPPAASLQPSLAEEGFDYAKLSKHEVGLGLLFSKKRYRRLFGHPQSLQILELDPRQQQLRLRVAAQAQLFRTSELARKRGAIAAINGGYFTKSAAAVGLLRVDGKQLFGPHKQMLGALVIGKKGRTSIATGEGRLFAESRDALAAGPMLVQQGVIALGTEISHFDKRHPRTAVGIAKDGRIFFLTVDGRSPGKAAGMTCEELARIFVALGCEKALNLDGGGSTTMWIRGAGKTGVVNHPSDNKHFDPAGERRVANCVLIYGKDVLVLEESAVTPKPRKEGPLSQMRYLKAADASGGKWLRVPGQLAVGIDAKLDFPGYWFVQARLPKGAPWPESISWNPEMLESQPLKQRIRTQNGWVQLGQIKMSSAGILRLHFSGKQAFGIDALRLVQR
ncbi:MAG: hypothetical protein CSA62_06750 [Planctomycetota bacterium]|nr:MAG: hypothetical protein CSA62_06750 [Planctomycetota bacterium]